MAWKQIGENWFFDNTGRVASAQVLHEGYRNWVARIFSHPHNLVKEKQFRSAREGTAWASGFVEGAAWS